MDTGIGCALPSLPDSSILTHGLGIWTGPKAKELGPKTSPHIRIDDSEVAGSIKIELISMSLRSSTTGGSQIGGDVKSKSSGTVQIGPGTKIQGDVKLEDSQTIAITGNTITGDLKINDSKSATVTDNTIGWDLKISGVRKPVVSGNTVSGDTRIE